MKNAFILLNNHYRQRIEGVQKKLNVKAQMFVSNLLEQMTLSEKMGQMCQRQALEGHIDTHFTPQFSFGFGLTYSPLEYQDQLLSHCQIEAGQSLEASIEIKNLGQHVVVETVQLYIQDKVASVTQPVKELKGFKQVRLEPGECIRVGIILSMDRLKFYDKHNQLTLQKGVFQLWLGGNLEAQHTAECSLLSGSAE